MAGLSRGGCRAEVFGRGEAAQPAMGARVEEAGCVSPLQGEGSEITQASWILNPRCLFGRGSEGFSILQGLQMGVGLLPSDRMSLCRMALLEGKTLPQPQFGDNWLGP